MWMSTLDIYEKEMKLVIKIILVVGVILMLIGCGPYSCPTYSQSMEVYIPADSTTVWKFPVVIMDINRAAKYYADQNRLEQLKKEFPLVSAKIDSLQEVNNDIDSINRVIMVRLQAKDSLSTVQLETCEQKANAILREAKRQDARAEKAEEKSVKYKKQRNVLFGTSVAFAILLLILL